MCPETPPESLEALRRTLEELQRLVSVTQDSSNEPRTPTGMTLPADYGGMARLLGQVLLTYTAAGLRYWARAADGWAKALPLASQAMMEAAGPSGGAGGEGSRARLEELGAHLRELAAMPSEEGLRLVGDLKRLGLTVESRPRQDGEDPDGTYWRRWKVKP